MIKNILIIAAILAVITAIYFNGMPVRNQLVDKCTTQSVYCY